MPNFPEAKKVDPVYEIDGKLCRPLKNGDDSSKAIAAIVQGRTKKSLVEFVPLTGQAASHAWVESPLKRIAEKAN